MNRITFELLSLFVYALYKSNTLDVFWCVFFAGTRYGSILPIVLAIHDSKSRHACTFLSSA